jgi:ATP-dependent protease ClpP protease subunit
MKEVWVRFLAPVIPQTTDALFQILDTKIREGYTKLHLMISSPGGDVFHGISLYNFLKGTPIEIDTYNFGSVDSIGVIIFCAGKKRYSVPHARFLMHGVRFNFSGNNTFDEKQLEEHLKSLKIDQQNIAKIIADTTGKTLIDVENDMNNRTTLNPPEAKTYGLIHEIKSELLQKGAEFYTIGEQGLQFQTVQPPSFPMIQGVPIQMQIPLPGQAVSNPINSSFTRSIDLSFSTLN